MRVKILNVDMNGYNGREHHPEETDRGRIVTVLKMTAYQATEDGEWNELSTLDAPESVPADDIVDVFECITVGGKKLELIGHEVDVRQ